MMRIDLLSSTQDRAGRYHVKFSDGTSMRLYRQTVEDFGLYPGKELTPEAFSQLTAAASKMSARMRAIRIVSASSVSKRDLKQRLIHKGEDPQDAAEAVEWMEQLNLLDDRKTAEQVVRSCAAKGYGLQRARQALYEKQIPRSLWDEVLEDYPEQTEKIAAFLRSRLGCEWDNKDLKRAVDAAMRRGHSYPDIRKALSLLQADADEFPEEW